jgi:hypothetical protein
MFSAKEMPAIKERTATIRVQLPVRLIDQLNRLAEARRLPFEKHTSARDQVAAELLDRALQPVAPLSTSK